MLILHVCCTEHVPALHATILFGMGNQLLLLYIDAPFLQPCCCWRRILILFVYLDAHALHLLEDHDDLQILIKSKHLLAYT